MHIRINEPDPVPAPERTYTLDGLTKQELADIQTALYIVGNMKRQPSGTYGDDYRVAPFSVSDRERSSAKAIFSEVREITRLG